MYIMLNILQQWKLYQWNIKAGNDKKKTIII